MITIRAHQSNDGNGYTIVEVVMVIVVIGILAGISIAGYSQWRTSVAKREVQSDLQGIASAMESKRNFDNVYPTTLAQLPFSASPNVTLTYKSGSSTVYCVEAASIKVPTVIYHLDSTNGNKTPQAGIC